MSESRIGGAADVMQGGEISDESLLERLAAGTDQQAASEIYDRYQGAMYGLAIRITRDQALAEDAVQEAFVGVWRNASRYAAGRASVRTWMLAITHHRAIDILRRRRATIEMPDADSGEAALSVPDVWPEVSRSLDRDTLRGAIETLPSAQRQAIELAYFDGLTQVEISERTGAPLGTVKSRVRLGLQQMRSVLEER